MKKTLQKISSIIVSFMLTVLGTGFNAFAANGSFSVSPMNQKIILNAGETYRGSFNVSNPAKNESDFPYKVIAQPFYVDDKYDIYYDNNADYNKIVDWVTIDNPKGNVSPNETKTIRFSVKVPKDAPAGGQYVALTVTSDEEAAAIQGINITAQYSIAHIVYAEIAGTTKRSGEITKADVPSFLFSGQISGTSSIKNTGNVHSTATYKLQVFPLFSDEEVYTNEEKPEEKTILPDRTLMNTSYWYETPSVGIYKVIYTAEFEGVTSKTEKMVIVCPLWLLFIIIFAIILIIFWLFSRNKSRKK